MLGTYVIAADFRAIGLTVAALVFLGFVAVFVWNIVRARPELGSEIELAANRKEYLSDEELEGEKLDRSLSFALVLLTLLAITLPFYWLAEPGRQAGAAEAYNASFESRGEGSYGLGGSQCVNCHSGGGVGGTAPYVLQDADGQFVANAAWKAPALNNVLLRYSEDEVRYILNYGRPGSPMAAWGTPGGGPLTTQQIDNIIIYLRTIQNQSLDPIDIAADAEEHTMSDGSGPTPQEQANDLAALVTAEVDRSLEAGEYATVGEAVFNLGLNQDFSAGAYSCGRCHTSGWSLGTETAPDVLDQGVAGCGGGNPSGIGFGLCGGSVKERFPDDTWLRPDGSWYVELSDSNQGHPVGYDGSFIEANDGTQVALNENGAPVTPAGVPYFILGPAESSAEAVDAVDAVEDAETEATVADDRNGDLAECAYVSGLWQPDGGAAYAFAPDTVLTVAPGTDTFVDPEPLTLEDVGPGAFVLDDGKIVNDCQIIDMPPRTSQAHYDFVYEGAEAGSGYGRGGQSSAGMMPGFGKILPPEYIQAVVDYERGL